MGFLAFALRVCHLISGTWCYVLGFLRPGNVDKLLAAVYRGVKRDGKFDCF